MREFVVITDTTSDLSKELREKYNIDYFRMNILVDGKETPTSLDWDIYSPKELYDWMRKGKKVQTTQVTREEFEKLFKKYLDLGKDILYVACSSGLSGSYNTSKLVAEELLEEYKDAKIECIDSRCACLALGALAIDAAFCKQEGKSLDDTVAYIESRKFHYNQVGTIDTLTYLARAGRIKGPKAFFGNLFGIKPIVSFDYKGQNVTLPQKVKGRKNGLTECVNVMKEHVGEYKDQVIYIAHADCLEDAEFIKELIIKEIGPREVYITPLGPSIGASVGPGMIAIYAYGKERVEG